SGVAGEYGCAERDCEKGREYDVKGRQRSDERSIELVNVVASNAQQVSTGESSHHDRPKAHVSKTDLYAGGGAGDRLKSNQSDISSACASLWLSEGSPNKDSQKRTRLTCECNCFEM